MSFHLAAWAMDVDVPPREKLVLILLASHADEHGACFPSQAHLAHRSGHSKRTILRALADLEEQGIITRQERRRADGSRSSDLIRLNLRGAPVRPPLSGVSLAAGARVVFAPQGDNQTPPDDICADHGDSESPRGDNECTPECPVVTAESVNEPVNEPSPAATAASGPGRPKQDALIPTPNKTTLPQSPTAQTLLAEWIDHCHTPPPARVRGHVARELKTLLDEGHPHHRVREALIEWNRRGLHPSTLPSVLHELNTKHAPPRPRITGRMDF